MRYVPVGAELRRPVPNAALPLIFFVLAILALRLLIELCGHGVSRRGGWRAVNRDIVCVCAA